ncbi:MAG: hypothetical protein KJO54_00485 [Gammaproteobacteria bacterium]|nr:hypothetical protein [Gammaproteobacteria bacterium]NNF61840.1 hypothetical protein [Gammaproteobacteria bacterium]
MSEYLVLKLAGDPSGQCSWVVADSDGHSSLPESGSLTEAAQRAQQRPVIALVPGDDVLVTTVDLPVRGAGKMLQAVPYALEEDIAENIRDMHFAIGRRAANGRVNVAAVRDELLKAWLEQLDAAGLNTLYMLPETCGIPMSDAICIVIDGDKALVRDAAGNALVAETENVSAFVQAIGIDAQSAASAELYISSADSGRYAQQVGELRLVIPELAVMEARDHILPVMAGAALENPRPNLLQGSYARSSSKEKLWQPWRTAAALAAALVLAALGTKALEVMALKAEMRSLTEQINSIASTAMPGSRLVDPMAQLEQLAASLRGNGAVADGQFLDMLDALGKALTVAGGTTLGRLDYRNGLMDLTLTAPDVDTLDRISRSIESGGLAAEIQSANQRDDGIQGRIRISGQQS